MKILHIISGNLDGGAARGAYWLHKALLKLNINSKILTNSKIKYNDDTITYVTQKQIYRSRQEKSLLDEYPKRIDFIFSTGFVGFDFTKIIEYQEADIINLHWINNSFVNIKDLSKIKKPLVWTIRDMWPMTGGCHYAFDCKKYMQTCGSCNQLKSNDENDLSNLIFKYKKENIPKNIQIVGISNWISDEARNSALYKNTSIKTILNNIDSNQFKLLEKVQSKNKLELPLNKKIVLIGAKNISDIYKGFNKFIEASKYLNKDKYFLCVFGNAQKNIIESLGFQYKLFGQVNDIDKLNTVYASADVFIAPSIMEAFGKTLVESMLSGTPVVCFNATGPKDIVTHKIDGYKAKAFDSSDLAKGIEWIVDNDNYEELRDKARENAYKKFDSLIIAQQYIALYQEILLTFKYKEISKETNINIEVDKLLDNKNNKNKFSQLFGSFYECIEEFSISQDKYIIYGNGTIGKTIQALIPEKIIGYVDIADKENHPENLKNIKYDKIIISVLGREDGIIKYLVDELGIERDDIVTFDI